MRVLRQIISALGLFIGIWFLLSCAGAYLDPVRASFWSASLMWSLLSSLLIAPALVLFYDASQPSASSDGDSPQAAQRTASAASHSQSPKATRKSFMDDGVGAAHSVSEESETPPATEEERPDWVKAHLE